MGFRNNVTRLLESKRVSYQVHQYDYEGGVHSAVEVAGAIGFPPERVFKTLVALTDEARRKPLLVVVSGPETLNLKKLAKAVGAKKVKMASHKHAESLTGLQTGGISPLALINKGFDVYIDESARQFETIAVSAGQRGTNIEVNPAELIKLTGARTIALGQ